MLECAKTGDRSGPAWQKILQRFKNLQLVVSDAAKGIAKGVRNVAAARAKNQSRRCHWGRGWTCFIPIRRRDGCWRGRGVERKRPGKKRKRLTPTCGKRNSK